MSGQLAAPRSARQPRRAGLPGPLAAYCLTSGLSDLERQDRVPRAPGRREEVADVERTGPSPKDPWCLSEVDIFADLCNAEMECRMSETVFTSVPPRIATTCICSHTRTGVAPPPQHPDLPDPGAARCPGRHIRETTTKVLGEYAELGLLRVGHDRVIITDLAGLHAEVCDWVGQRGWHVRACP